MGNYLKDLVRRDSWFLRAALFGYNHLPFNNRFRTRGAEVAIHCAQLKKTTLDVHGTDNVVRISSGCRLKNCGIHIFGNGNRVILDGFVSLNNAEIWIEDDHNEIHIGEHTSSAGAVQLACIEGTKISIGKDCMFSGNISIRTGDSHSVLDLDGNRINPSRDVCIGDHVWIGNTVLMTKGAAVQAHSIVGTGSVVTRQFAEDHVVIAGNPAKIVKHGVSWDRNRIPMPQNAQIGL